MSQPKAGPAAPLRRLPLRDRLAGQRTMLANDRTFLAAIRTAISLAAAGAVLLRFFEHPLAVLAGWALFPLGGAVFVYGLVIFLRMRRLIVTEECGDGGVDEGAGETEGEG